MHEPSFRVVLLTLALPLLAAPALGRQLTARLHGAMVQPSERLRLGPSATSEDRIALETSGASGVAVAGELRLNRRFGLELAALRTALDVEVRIAPATGAGGLRTVERLRIQPLALGANLHLTPGRRLDLYVGPRVALVQYGDLAFDFSDAAFSARFTVDDDLAYGGLLGAELPFARWAASAALLYLPTSAQIRETDARIELDLLVASLGIAYRF